MAIAQDPFATSGKNGHSHPKYRPDIDGLRAVAVVSVVLFHAGFTAMGGGFIGVDIFFVISGYLISGILIKEIGAETFTLGAFYERRIRRIFPALFAVLAVCLLVGALVMTTRVYRETAVSAAAAALSLSNVYFLAHTNYFDFGATTKPLLHTWSLAVEEQFYLGFPIYLILARRVVNDRWPLAVGAVILVSFVIGLLTLASSPQAAFYLPFGRLWELALGGWLASLTRDRYSRIPQHVAEGMSAAGLMLLLGSILLISEKMPFPGWVAVVPCLGTALIIAGGTAHRTMVSRLLGCRPFTAVGLISYSLYLWHWPVLVYLRLISQGMPDTLSICAALTAITLLAYLSWRFIEQVVRRNHDLFNRQRLFAGSFVVVALLCVVAGVIDTSKGLPARFAPAERRIDRAAGDINPDRRRCDAPSLNRLAKGSVCVLGTPGVAPVAAIFGDSFADALVPGVARAALDAHQSVAIFTRSGCRPLLGLDTRESCEAAIAGALRAIRANPTIRSVIYVGRWPQMTEGSRFGMVDHFDAWMVDKETRVAGPEENVRVFARRFDATVAGFGNKRVFVVTGIPEQRVMAPQTSLARLRLGLALPHGVDRAQVDKRYAHADMVMADIARQRPFSTIDLRAVMCAGSTCPAVTGSLIRYVDDNHPSRTMSQRMAGAFIPAFATGDRIPAR